MSLDITALIQDIKLQDVPASASITDLDRLNEQLRVLCQQENILIQQITLAKSGELKGIDMEELQKTFDILIGKISKVSNMIAKVSSSTTTLTATPSPDSVLLSPGSKKKVHAGPPEIPPDEIIFDKVKDFIGGGAYGKVYRGLLRGKQVAVKVPIRQNLSEAELKGFRNEVEIMRHIFHPNVVLFLGACTQPGNFMIVTELMETDMERLVHHNSQAPELSVFDRMKMAKDAALGMNWLHGICKIIHRDLKPANLLVDKHKTVKVTDFGFSQTLKKDQHLLDKKGPKGTALYMAPEVMRQEGFNEKADVYSFGLILHELLTGEELFPNYDELDPFYQAICYQHERPVPPPTTLPSLARLMTRCWDPLPESRPSFTAITQSLDEILVELKIRDPTAQKFWKDHFAQRTLQEQVSWKDFYGHLVSSLKTTFESSVEEGLASILATTPAGGRKENRVVTMERFDLTAQWFGNFYSPNGYSICQEIAAIASQKWFHGLITKDLAEARLNFRPDNTFLVRLSLSDPHLTPFTISRLKNNRPTHKRVTKHSTGLRYSVPVDNQEVGFDSLLQMITHLKNIKNLGLDCPQNEITSSYSNE